MKKIEQLKSQVNLNKKPAGKDIAPDMLSKINGGGAWGQIWLRIRF